MDPVKSLLFTGAAIAVILFLVNLFIGDDDPPDTATVVLFDPHDICRVVVHR